MEPYELEKLLPRWAISLRSEGKSKKTVLSYTTAVRQVAAWQREQGIPEFGIDAARSFIASIVDGGGRSTASVRACGLRNFAVWLAAEGLAPAGMLMPLKVPAVKGRRVCQLMDAEVTALQKACSQGTGFLARRDETIFRFMLQTGARSDETMQMDVCDLNLEQQFAVLREGKGGRQRAVHLSPETIAALSIYLLLRRERGAADAGPLWLASHGGRLSYDGLRQSLGRTAAAAGIKSFALHRIRHTAAVRWKAKGGSEDGMMTNFGWTSREMPALYTADAAEKLAFAESRLING